METQRFAPLAVLIGTALIACAGSPTSLSTSHKPPTPPSLVVTCAATSALRCNASVFGEGDTTALAAWSAADAFRGALDLPMPASSAVAFPAPGVVTVLRSQNIYIRADYVSPTWGRMRSIAPYAYALDVAAPPVPLAYLDGQAFVGAGTTTLGGVTVEIIEGEGKGKQAVTLASNGAYMIEFLRLSVPFTARASKPGYTTDVKTHAGIIDSASGYPSNAFLHFNLSPLQQF